MSGQSLIMFISVVAIALAANRAEDTTFTSSARGPASLAHKKDLGLIQKSLIKHTHKLRGPLAVAVELVGEAPQQNGDVFILRGSIRAETDLRDLDFAWRLPAGVEVVNGETASVVSRLDDGKVFETQITLRQVSSSNVRVSLRVRGNDAESRFSDSAQYNTMDQAVIEASRKELQKSTEDYARDEKRLKIFH